MAKVAKKRKTFVDVLFEKRRGMVRLENAGAASLRRQMRTIKRDALGLIERNMSTFRRTGKYIDSVSALATAERTATEMDILLQQRLAGPTSDVIRLRQTAWDQGVIDLKGASRRLPQGIQSSMNASFGQVDLQAAIAARTNPVFGVNPRAAFNGVRGHTSKKVQELLSSAVLSSASVKETAQQLADAMDLNVAAAQRIVRTNMNAAYNEAHRAIYNANPEIFIGYRWEAVFDDRTSVVCLELHGSFYALGTVPPGPPAHWNCRSILVGVFRDAEIEALADIDERRVREFKELPDGTIKSTTKLVATHIPADDWLKSQPFSVVQSVTGSRLKAELFLQGTANLSDIVSPALGIRNNAAFIKRVAALHPSNKRLRKIARELGVKKIPSKATIVRGDAISAGKQPFDIPGDEPFSAPGVGTFARRQRPTRRAVLREARKGRVQELPKVEKRADRTKVLPSPEIDEKKWIASLTDRERAALEAWGSFSPQDIRVAIAGRSVSADVKRTADAFKAALSRAPRESGQVFRGLRDLTPKGFKKLSTGENVVLKSVASSSKSRKIGEGFIRGTSRVIEGATTDRNILFRIRSQTSGVAFPDEFATFKGQREVLLSKGTRFRIVGRRWKRVRERLLTPAITRRARIIRYLELTLEEI